MSRFQAIWRASSYIGIKRSRPKLLAVALIGIKPLDLVAFASTLALMVLVAALATKAPAP